MEPKGIKVLMMGGRRAGKSSMLAGLFDIMLGEEIKKLIQVKETTEGRQDSLTQKINSLKDTLKEKKGKTILVDKGKTDDFRTYSLQFTIPNTDHSINVSFTDADGEYFNNSAKYAEKYQEVKRRVRESDVVLVAIDAVFMMEGDAGQNRMANCVDDVCDLLKELQIEEQTKLVAFVPIKCERWAQDNDSINEMTKRVEDNYASAIRHLESNPMVEMIILPVQTVGSIKFKELLPALVYQKSGKPHQCSLIEDDSKLRFSDGDILKISARDYPDIQEDPEGVFRPSTIERPNAWFKVKSDVYAPKNCEQLAYHILRYVLYRYIDATKLQKQRSNTSWWKWILAIAALATGFGWLYAATAVAFLTEEKTGNVSVEDAENLLKKLVSGGYIKDAGDGIKILKSYHRI